MILINQAKCDAFNPALIGGNTITLRILGIQVWFLVRPDKEILSKYNLTKTYFSFHQTISYICFARKCPKDPRDLSRAQEDMVTI